MNWNHLRKHIVFEGTEDGFTPTKQIIAPASLLQFFSCPRSPGSTLSPAASKVRKHLLVAGTVVQSILGWVKYPLEVSLRCAKRFNKNFKGDGPDGRWSLFGWNTLLQHNGKRLMSKGICSLHLLLYVRCCIQPAIFRNISKSASVRLFPLLNENKAPS